MIRYFGVIRHLGMIRKLGSLTLAMAALTASGPAFAERISIEKDWTERFDVGPDTVLTVENIWGDVIVEPGAGNEVVLDITERRSAPNQARFERSLDVLPVTVEGGVDGVYAGVGLRDWDGNYRGFRGNTCRGCRVEVTFRIQAPPGLTLDLSAVNDGAVLIHDMRGTIYARNVNGPVSLTGARGCEELESINGEVTLEFAEAPVGACRIETINGDIHLEVPDRAGLDMATNLTNGRLYSSLPADPLAMPAQVEQTERDGRFEVRVTQPAGLRLAGGGALFTVTSLNGDVRIEKQ